MKHEPSNSRSRIWVVLIIPLMFACDRCPPEPAVSKIRVEDTHVSTWMVFDNGWTGHLGPRHPPTPTDGSLCKAKGVNAAEKARKKFGMCTSYVDHDAFIPGVMFQLGTLYEPDLADPTQLTTRDHLDYVELTIEPPGLPKDVVILREEADDKPAAPTGSKFFDWLDILWMKGTVTNQECVIDAKHAYMLFENAHASTVCDPADWDNQCLRNRSLHAAFRADKGVITYWTNPRTRYSIATAKMNVAGHSNHITYDFNLNEVVSVDVWRDGCWQERFDHVTNVLIKYVSDPFHGGYHDPPMDGGTPRGG